MIKYCFCFFLCLLTINGAYEEDEAEPCYESSIVKCGPIKELGEFDDIFDYASFWAPDKFLPYLHFAQVKLPKLPVLNDIPQQNHNIEIMGDITKLSEDILQIFATRTPEIHEGPFRLYFSDFPLIANGLNAFLKIINTPDPQARGRTWKVQAFIRCFERIWKTKTAQVEMTNGINIQAVTEMNAKLRQLLAIVLGLKRDINYKEIFFSKYPTLAKWANTCTKNESGKPIEAVLTICLIDACTQWKTPNLAPVFALPSTYRQRSDAIDFNSTPTSRESLTMLRSSNSMQFSNCEEDPNHMNTFLFPGSPDDSSDDSDSDDDDYGVGEL